MTIDLICTFSDQSTAVLRANDPLDDIAAALGAGALFVATSGDRSDLWALRNDRSQTVANALWETCLAAVPLRATDPDPDEVTMAALVGQARMQRVESITLWAGGVR